MSPYIIIYAKLNKIVLKTIYKLFFAKFGAEDGAQTRDLCLGKASLYQLSYFRISFKNKAIL